MNVSKLADINIPQGRGMIKWAPFATMPEQYENVNRLKVEQAYVPKPDLSDELQQERELKLRESIGKNIILRYWQARAWMTGAGWLLCAKRTILCLFNLNISIVWMNMNISLNCIEVTNNLPYMGITSEKHIFSFFRTVY